MLQIILFHPKFPRSLLGMPGTIIPPPPPPAVCKESSVRNCLRNLNEGRTVRSILLVKKLLGLVEMMSGLVNASFSLPEWLAVKMIFFAPCTPPPPWCAHTHTHTQKKRLHLYRVLLLKQAWLMKQWYRYIDELSCVAWYLSKQCVVLEGPIELSPIKCLTAKPLS